MRKDSMTPAERWQAVFQRRPSDRTPMDYWATPETSLQLTRSMGCATLREALQKLHVDFVIGLGGKYIGPSLPPNMDVFGIRYRTIEYATGSYPEAVEFPLANYKSVDEIKAHYRFPSPDWWDYSILEAQIQGWEEYPCSGGGSEPFLIYKNLRGQEQAFFDLIENPEIVEYCLANLFELAYQETLRIFEKLPGRILYSYVAEDLGAQNDLMIAPHHIRQFLFPGMQRMTDLIHQAGAYVFHHNDGNITRILPEMVDMGIDLLNPIQWRANGMDRQMLKDLFGKRIIFHGGVDNQYTLPFGTVEEVRQEVRDNLRILGAGGGYILAPCHNIQPLTPLENIITMYETCYQEG
jgi:uroporphyrinogen decarboxylase